MLSEDIIRHSKSSYSSELVMVKKKDGTWRVCVDYRDLNKITIKDNYPLLLIRDLLASIKGSQYFVTIDLRSGYWQIPMEKNSAQFTAFRFYLGVYEFKIMPFGLTNAPATFQRCMDYTFNEIKDQGILVYMDDILIHAETFDKLKILTNEVFKRLQNVGLTFNLEKIFFRFQSIKYLGQIISKGEMRPDPKRVEALRKLKSPQNIIELRGLIVLIGYFQKYIHHYAQLMKPLFQLLPTK